MIIFMIIFKPTLSIFSKVSKDKNDIILYSCNMIQVPIAEPIAEDPIMAIDTTNIVIVEPEPMIAPQPPALPQTQRTCPHGCVICGICTISIIMVLCFSIPF